METLAGTIVGSKHDLSISNEHGPEMSASKEICVFCHTPHAASDAVKAPIWNRKITDTTVFQLYGEGTPIGSVPNAVSLACLSCHDGVSSEGVASAVSALDTHTLINYPNGDSGSPNCNACHPDGGVYPSSTWQIGPILTDDHPISISYTTALANDPTGFEPSPLNGVKLFGVDNEVECATCHDVHNPENGTFLRVNNAGSELCLSCHKR